MLLLSLAHAGPDTLVVGYEHSPELLSPWSPECFEAARVCWFEADDSERARIEALPGLRYVERDRPMPGLAPPPVLEVEPDLAPPSDRDGTEDCNDLWELELFGELSVQGTEAPVVAIQDGGFRLTHEELEGRISGQWDYGDGDSQAELNWNVGVPAHGGFIGGMIAGRPDNDAGRAGLAPYAMLNLQKIADSSGALYWSYAIAAMDDLADGDLGVRVLNYSLGGASYTSGFYDAVQALESVDILVVAAAGNCASAHCWDADNDAHGFYPAGFAMDHVISVAGSTREDELNPYSHYGVSTVDLAAPGVDLCSLGAYSDDDYYTSGGTSYATPLVAATAALLLEAHPELSPLELGRVLRASAHETSALQDKVISGGRLDPAAALATAVPRLEQPQDLSLAGRGDWTLRPSNVGAEASRAVLLLFYPEGLELRDSPALTRFEAGETLELPDAGSWTATAPGSLLELELSEHESEVESLVWIGRELGEHSVQTRLVLASEGADYLNAPYREGSTDPTGFLAWSSTLTVTEVAEPADSPADSGLDSAPRDSEGGHDTGPGEELPGGCACSTGSSSSLGWGLLMLLGLTRRRR